MSLLSIRRSAHYNAGTDVRQANFRSGSPSHLSLGAAAQPVTGLSMLMNGGCAEPPLTTAQYHPPTALSTMENSSSGVPLPENTNTNSNHNTFYPGKYSSEMDDRERQASALAAAGMVAESVKISNPGGTAGLLPPPALATAEAMPVASAAATASEIDAINWGMMDAGAMHLDDMDLDFAALFDPAQEVANMHTEGSGWPLATAASSASNDESSMAASPTPFASMSDREGSGGPTHS